LGEQQCDLSNANWVSELRKEIEELASVFILKNANDKNSPQKSEVKKSALNNTV